MEDNNTTTTGWKSDAQPIPAPIALENIDEDALIIKRGDKDDKRI